MPRRVDDGWRGGMHRVRVLVALVTALLFATSTRVGVARAADEVIVFLVPSGADAGRVRAALDAIRAHLADVSARIVYETSQASPDDLRAQVEAATQASARHHAVGTFWLDEGARGDTLLYFAEPGGARVLVRHVKPGAGGATTVQEEVAVITRSTVQALLEGGQIGMVPVEAMTPTPPPKPKPRPTPPAASKPAPRDEPPRASPVAPRRRDWLRLGAAYVGSTFAPEVPWQNGVGIWISVLPLSRVYLGVGYTLLGSAQADSSSASVTVVRHPIEAAIGYEHPLGPVAAQIELAGSIDPTRRSTEVTAPEYQAMPDETHVAFALSPRARAVWPMLPRLRLSIGAGPEMVLNRVDYVVRTPAREALISPWPVRLRVDAGLAATLW